MIIKRKYPEQKEFGIISGTKKLIDKTKHNIYTTPKRKFQKYIGRKRREEGWKIYDNIENLAKENKKFAEERKRSVVINKNLEDKLIKEAEKLGGRVIKTKPTIQKPISITNREPKFWEKNKVQKQNTQIPSKKNQVVNDEMDNFIVNKKAFLKSNKSISGISSSINNEIKNNSLKGIDSIVHKEGSGVENLAHEIGHLSRKRNPISILANSSIVRNGRNTNLDQKVDSPRLTFLKRKAKGWLINKEEKEASKKGLELMKKNNANKKELQKAKENLNYSLGTYKNSNKISQEIARMNYKQIPSERGKIYKGKDRIRRNKKRERIKKEKET